MESVEHVVADSGAFIRNASLKDIGNTVYTIPNVVNEIRDKTTRDRLQVLPYELKLKYPMPESIKFVTEFSKKTGDYKSLSATDLKVIALTYELESQYVGKNHIKPVPDKKIEWSAREKPTSIAGFYLEGHKASGTKSECINSQNEDVSDRTGSKDVNNFSETTAENNSVIQNLQSTDTEPLKEGDLLENLSIDKGDSDIDSDEQETESEDDSDGWITPGNIKQVKAFMGEESLPSRSVKVGCITTDFAMQNVLIQMGLNVISVDGMLIKYAKSYVLRCFACMKITNNMTKDFCPHCGNNTLQKISMSINEDGTIRYYMSRKKPVTRRGMKYSLPMPKGGKHSQNPVLCEDQPLPQQRAAKSGNSRDSIFSPEYMANKSPFAMNDVTSRSAILGIHGNHGKNPNSSRKRTGRRK